MNTQDYRINRLSRRYHLRPTRRDQQRIMDAMLNEVVNEYLQPELDELAIDAREEICIREVDSTLCIVDNGQSQAQTSRRWSREISQRIRQVISQGGSNVIRYRSRQHAVQAVVDGITAHRLDDAWAWNQLGLTQLPPNAGQQQANSQLVSLLLRESPLLLELVLHLADQARLFPWLQELSVLDAESLIQAVMRRMQVDGHWMQASAPLPLPDATSSAYSRSEVAAHSRIARHLARYLADGTIDSNMPEARSNLRTWSILVALELEPLLFQRPGPRIQQCLQSVESALQPQPLPRDIVERSAPSPKKDAQSPGAKHDVERQQSAQDPQSSAIDEALKADRLAMDNNTRPDSSQTPRLEQSAENKELPTDQSPGIDTQSMPADQHQQSYDSTELQDPAVATNLYSDYAGLFFLIAVFNEAYENETSLIKKLADDEALSEYSLSWLLYQLLSLWFDIPHSDVALRLFCHIAVEDDWPWPPDSQQPSPHETNLLDGYRAGFECLLLARFDNDHDDASQLLKRICQRRARIEIDGPWLELVLDLDQVDTDIRRAALDLDPGFVPWLGKVVKIRYE